MTRALSLIIYDMRNTFPLFQGHLDLAHQSWRQIARAGDTVIDATCGNGHDTLALAQCVLGDDFGRVLGMDIQETAIASTRELLSQSLPEKLLRRVELRKQSHARFPEELETGSVALIVYNFGYLPGGDKSLTTQLETSLLSLENALPLIQPGGAISLTLYPGHEAGDVERRGLLEWIAQLSPKEWSACHHEWVNRRRAPSWLLLQKAEL